MLNLIPNHSKQSHIDAVEFKTTAEFAGTLCLRSLDATTHALGLALQNSIEEKDRILTKPDVASQERAKLLSEEGKREWFFRDLGPAQHLVACTTLTYATLDTVLAKAVRLLDVHSGTSSPNQNKRGASVQANMAHFAKVMPELLLMNRRDRVVLDDFSKVRNILIHEGYFVNAANPQIAALRASENYVDYFEILPGFPIILREHGVRHFVTICNELIRCVAAGVYQHLVSK